MKILKTYRKLSSSGKQCYIFSKVFFVFLILAIIGSFTNKSLLAFVGICLFMFLYNFYHFKKELRKG